MYEKFYGLSVDPFRLSPDHRFSFSHSSYAKAKSYIQYALHRAEGFVMITGKPGTGKTTLVNEVLHGLSRTEVVVATLVSTQLEADDLLRMVAYLFGLDAECAAQGVGAAAADGFSRSTTPGWATRAVDHRRSARPFGLGPRGTAAAHESSTRRPASVADRPAWPGVVAGPGAEAEHGAGSPAAGRCLRPRAPWGHRYARVRSASTGKSGLAW